MVCPVCPAAGWFGGLVGGYFGIQPPRDQRGRMISAAITATLISTTLIAVKVLFNVSLCRGGEFTLANIACVGAKTLIMGVIYSIGVNYLLNRYVFPPPQSGTEQNHSSKETTDESSSLQCPCRYKKEG